MAKEELRATLSLSTGKGVDFLLTIPHKTTLGEVGEMLKLISETDNLAGIEGFVKKAKSYGAKKAPATKNYVDKDCPKCDGKLHQITTKTGKTLIKCDKSTFINGVAGGCDYVEWGEDNKGGDEEKFY